jgi:hypothetical protein
LDVVDLGPREQERRDGGHDGGDPDADEHEPVRRQPAAVREQVDRGRGGQAPDERGDRQGPRARTPAERAAGDDHEDGRRAGAGGDPE